MKRTLCCALALMMLLGVGRWEGALGEATLKETVKAGKVTEAVWTDETGSPTAGPEGWTIVRYTYGKTAGVTTEMYYDAAGEPYCTAGGYYGLTKTLDGKKRVTDIVYLDEDGRRADNGRGYSRVKMEYTSFNAVRSVSYLDESNQPVMVPSLGYAQLQCDYRGKTMTRRATLDGNGKEVDTAAGYAVITQRINKKNQVLGIAYTHADGSPATCPDGWSRCERELDKNGRELSTKYYDESGKLTDRDAGYAWEEREYAGKNEIRITRYDLEGNAVETDGYTTLVQKWKDDLLIRESYVNQANQPVADSRGIGSVEYGYDDLGRLCQVHYRDPEGAACAVPEGYYGYRDTLNPAGQVTSRIYLDREGKAAETLAGYAEIRYTYDAAGERTETRYYSASGEEVQP